MIGDENVFDSRKVNKGSLLGSNLKNTIIYLEPYFDIVKADIFDNGDKKISIILAQSKNLIFNIENLLNGDGILFNFLKDEMLRIFVDFYEGCLFSRYHENNLETSPYYKWMQNRIDRLESIKKALMH